MSTRVRPLDEADLPALAAIDAAYAAAHGLEGAVSPGALRFFGRNEHSFTAEDDGGGPTGFLLAQAVWTGDRPLVLVTRLAARPDAEEDQAALVRALVKSAYDAGVYDLLARAPRTDPGLQAALAAEAFPPDEQLAFVRVLGSRGAARQAGTEAHHG